MDNIYVTIRIKTSEVKSIDQLINAGATRSRSDFIRKATRALLSQYTGEVDINNVEKRLREVENKVNLIEAKLNDLQH